MSHFDPIETLEQTLKAHGLTTVAENGWILVDGRLPATRAVITPVQQNAKGAWSVRLDVEVAFSTERSILESFAGVGEDIDEAGKGAFANFTVNSLYVLLAAIWGVRDESHVTRADWRVAGEQWEVFVGNLGAIGTRENPPEIPESFFPTLERLVGDLSPTDSLNWIRTFYCNVGDGETITEALLNNAEWPEAVAAIEGLPWPKEGHYFSVRNFLVFRLRPGQERTDGLPN